MGRWGMKITWTRTKLYHLAAVILGIGSVGDGAMAQSSTILQDGGKQYTHTLTDSDFKAIDSKKDLFKVTKIIKITSGPYSGKYMLETNSIYSTKSQYSNIPIEEKRQAIVSEDYVKNLSVGDVVLLSESDATASKWYNIEKITLRDYMKKLSTDYDQYAKKSKAGAVKDLAETLKKNVASMNDQDEAMAQTKNFNARIQEKVGAFSKMQNQQTSQFKRLQQEDFNSDLDVQKSGSEYYNFQNKKGSEYAKAEKSYNAKYYLSKHFISFQKSTTYKEKLGYLHKEYEQFRSAFDKKWSGYENDFNASQNADKKRFDDGKKILEDQLKATNDINSLSWDVLDTKNYTNGSQFIEFGEKYVYQQEVTEKEYTEDLENSENRSRSSSTSTDPASDQDSDAGDSIAGE